LHYATTFFVGIMRCNDWNQRLSGALREVGDVSFDGGHF